MTGAGRVRAICKFSDKVAAHDGDRPGFRSDHVRVGSRTGVVLCLLKEVVELIHKRIQKNAELEVAAVGDGDVAAGVIHADRDDLHIGVQLIDRLQGGVPVFSVLRKRLVESFRELSQHGGELSELLHGADHAHERSADVAAVLRDLVHHSGQRIVGGVLIQLQQRADVGIAQHVVRSEVDRDDVGLLDRVDEGGTEIVERREREGLREGCVPDAVGVGVGAVEDVAQLNGAERAAAELQQICFDRVRDQIVVCAGNACKSERSRIVFDAGHSIAGGDAVADAHVGVIAAVAAVVVALGVSRESARETCEQQDHKDQAYAFAKSFHIVLLERIG